MGDFYSDTV